MRVCVFLLLALVSAANSAQSADTDHSGQAAHLLELKNVGLADLEEGRNEQALQHFESLAALLPDEPLPTANAAVAALRDGKLDIAESFVTRALAITKQRGDVLMVKAAVAVARSDTAAAGAALTAAADLEPRNLEARWRWIKLIESSVESGDTGAQRDRYVGEILKASPSNLVAWLRRAADEIGAGRLTEAASSISRIEGILANSEQKPAEYLAASRQLLADNNAAGAALKLRVAENLLRVSPRYLASLSELYTEVVGMPLTSFSSSFEASLRPRADAPITISFRKAKIGDATLSPEQSRLRADWMNTGALDTYKIPDGHTQLAFIDFDSDGDLDTYLYGGSSPDVLMRNNLDGSWTDVSNGFGAPLAKSTQVVVDDFDRDGDLDLLSVTADGRLHLYSNLRQGRFLSLALPPSKVQAVAAADLDADGWPDLVVAAGGKLALWINQTDGSFVERKAGDLSALPTGFVPSRIEVADLDNDGFPDLVLAGDKGLRFFRNAGLHVFTSWDISPGAASDADDLLVTDIDQDGDLDLLVQNGDGLNAYSNEGGNKNGWLTVQLEGLDSGSQKVNRRGVGSQVEIKAGNLYRMQTVSLQPTHFGLGRHRKADVLRTLWTNGVPQNVLAPDVNTTVTEVQRLKGSCPFVYAFNGETGEWSFVSDALGRAPIGLLYDGVNLAGADPREWLLLSPGQLAPNAEGRLRLDYTEELWEAVYLDMVRLAAVDHPAGTAVIPNERTFPGIPEKKLFGVAEARPLRAAYADGIDVTDKLAAADGTYVEPGKPTAYQGVRSPHELILDLGQIAEDQPLVLFFTGWIFYTDTSINVSISQREDLSMQAPVLEVPDGKGGWRVAVPTMGFPAGKTKIMPLDLTGLVSGDDPRVRIRTNLEIWWDQVYFTVGEQAVPMRTTELSPERADLAWRGFSRGYRANPNGPELFDHDDVDARPHWMDIPGKATRYGDVVELLRDTDDRLAVFVGGDVIHLEFDANQLPPLEEAWTRDWIVISDGWDKDFDKNTVTGTSIEPYPFHAMGAYPYPDGERLPTHAEQAHTSWTTREVGPSAFFSAVRDHDGPPLR